ncbi:MAG: hypothetical protein ACKO04_09910 [Actinomycetes bacterium]
MSDAAAQDEAAFAAYGTALADAVDAAVEDWVVRSVVGRCTDAEVPVTDDVRAQAAAAGAACRASVVPALRTLLSQDLAEQRGTPLGLLREAAQFPTEVLRRLGVPHVRRDGFDERADPEDVYALAPAAFADVDESLTGPGIAWGAAKAHVHMARHRPTGG